MLSNLLGNAFRWTPDGGRISVDLALDERNVSVGVEDSGPGISRVHCLLACDATGAWLEDRSTYGTYLNGERVGGRAALRAGDRMRLGNPGVELELVRVVGDDGAA